MPITVEVPDGTVEFPDSTSQEEIESALNAHYAPSGKGALESPKPELPKAVSLPPPGQRPFNENFDINEPSSGFEPGAYIPPGEKPPPLFQSFVPLPDPIKGKTLLGKAAAAVANQGVQLAGGTASLGGLMSLPIGLLGRVGAVAGGLGFGVPAVKEGLHRVYEGAALGDLQESMEGALQTGTGGLITIGGAKALLGKGKVPINEQDQIKGTSGVPVEQQGVTPDRPAEVQAQEGTAQRPSESVNPLPQPAEVPQEVSEPPKVSAKEYLRSIREQKIPIPERETITPAEDTPVGVNDAGEQLYQRKKDGTVYRMRNDRPNTKPYGYPDFGGDLSPVEPQEITPPSAPTPGVRQQVLSDVAAKGGEAAASSPAPAIAEGGTPEAIRQVTEPPVRSILEPEKGSGGDLQMTIAPGVKEFIEQDLTPKLQEASKVIGETAQQTKALLSPPSMSDVAQTAAGIAREGKAGLAQKDLQARLQFEEAKKAMDKLSKPESLAFTDSIEKGGRQPTPTAQRWADSLRSELDKRAAQVQALGTGKLEHLIQDYFPHLWKDPDATVSWYSRILGRRPLRGPASFLKQRSIPFTADGIAAGLEPVTWNPIELALLKMHEMDRYVMGQKIFNEYKDKGLLQFSRSDVPPEGYAKVDDRIANVVQYRPTTKANGQPGPPERILRGHYYAQEDAARVLNNFLSPGLERYAWYRTVRWMGNTMNLAQLGLSGYHFLFTMIDSSTGKLALGLEQASRGDVLKGAENVARGIAGIPGINQLEYFLKGSKVLKEYTKPGTVGGDYANIVDSLLAGGGRTEMPKIFKNSSLENFMTALRSGNYPGAVIRAPFAAIQAISHPLMQVVVPRLKLGAFTDMARYELEKLGPNATRDQIRKTMGGIWDSVDNRMGEMVYDNLFWNRTLKDTSFLAVRAVGWNLGTIRELGGGLVDSAKIIGRLQRGDPVMTRRMAYVMALPITVGTMGAMYQYMKTGKGPEELKDYFYPKTGKTLPDGTPERVNFPSYLKDIYAYAKHPFRTVTNKLHPLWSTMAEMINNKDYYGGQIRNPDDPLVKQIGEELSFVGRTFVPFSVKGAERRVGAKESPEIKGESFMGIMPIPPEIARTAAQNKIMEYGVAKMPQGAKTESEQQRQELKRDLESQIGNPQDYEKARSQLEQLRREGKLTRGQEIYERNKLNYQRGQMDAGKTKSEAQWLWRFRHLDLNEARHVYEVATPAEKKLFDRDLQLKERKADVNQ